jgi:L-serine/L-threonine ammonia-lyase
VSVQAFALARAHPVVSVVVSDQVAVRACMRFVDDHRVLVEPACGATLALAYDAPRVLADYKNVLAIVCGGVTTTLAQLQQWDTAQ